MSPLFTSEPDPIFAREAGLSNAPEPAVTVRTDADAAGLLFN